MAEQTKTFAVERVRDAGVIDEGRRIYAVLRDAIGRNVRFTMGHAEVPRFALRLIAAWRAGFAERVRHGHAIDGGVPLHGWRVMADRTHGEAVIELEYPEMVEQRTTAWPVPLTAADARRMADALMRAADEVEQV